MDLLSYADALKILEDAAADIGLLPFSPVPLKEAAGRVAASPLTAPEALPAFANSSMDGFAVPAARTAGASEKAPVKLPIAGILHAGDAAPCAPAAGTAYEIMTGAPMPAGCDSVVPIEHAARENGAVVLRSPAEPGDFVRPAGADFSAGDVVAPAGERLGPEHVMALAALGISRVPVRWKPKVALIFTGRELVEPGHALEPGQIRNASGPYLSAALERLGCEPRSYGTVADDPADFKQRLDAVLAQENDLILTTGAVSMGRRDFVAEAVADMGGQVLFHKTAIRPGKPILAARFGHGPLLLGLPGNPISTAVGLRFFAWPVLRVLLGQAPEKTLRARLEAAVEKPERLRCFFKARASAFPHGLSVEILPGQGSFQIKPLTLANAWAILPEGAARLPANAEIELAALWPGEGWGA